MDANLFTGITIDVSQIVTTLVAAVKIGLPAMIAVVAIERGVGFLKSAIRG